MTEYVVTQYFWYGKDRQTVLHNDPTSRLCLPTEKREQLEAGGHVKHGWNDYHLHPADEPAPPAPWSGE